MNREKVVIFILLSVLVFLPGCDLIIGIFTAGFVAAIFLVLILIAIIWWGINKYRSRD